MWTDLCSQVVTGSQVFEPEQAVPVACPPSTWIMLHNLMPKHTAFYTNIIKQLQILKICKTESPDICLMLRLKKWQYVIVHTTIS